MIEIGPELAKTIQAVATLTFLTIVAYSIFKAMR